MVKKRTVKKSLKEKNRNKKRIFWLFFTIILLAVGSIFIFKIFISMKNSLWDGKNRFNIVISADPVIISSFEPQDKSLSVLLVPEGTFIQAVHGYGPCRAEGIYRLGELNQKGAYLLTESLQSYFGLPLEAYLLNSKVDDNYDYQSVLSFKEFLTKKLGLKIERETNLNTWDLWRLFWFSRQIRPDKIEIIDLAETRATDEISLPDGSLAFKIDSQRLELITNQYFADRKIRDEDLTIAVLNGTKHTGLANKLAFLVKNIGGQVVRVGEIDPSEFSDDFTNLNCVVKTSKKYKSYYTVQKLINTFNCQWQENQSINERSSLVVIVGEGYWRLLNLP